MSESDQEPGAWRSALVIWFILIAAAAGLIAGVYVWQRFSAMPDDLSSFGTFYGGALGPVLGFLTFVGLLWTIWLQRRELAFSREELRLSRNELELSRKEYARSASALEGQHNAMKAQQQALDDQMFENTFFHMVALHNGIVDGLLLPAAPGGRPARSGRECFAELVVMLRALYEERCEGISDREQDAKAIKDAYGAFWKLVQSNVRHYYAYLFNILDLLHVHRTRNALYRRAFRAHLSGDELVLLVYNAAFYPGRFSQYPKELALFTGIDPTMLLRPQHIELLKPEAYGRREYGEFGNYVSVFGPMGPTS